LSFPAKPAKRHSCRRSPCGQPCNVRFITRRSSMSRPASDVLRSTSSAARHGSAPNKTTTKFRIGGIGEIRSDRLAVFSLCAIGPDSPRLWHFSVIPSPGSRATALL
jgi:hypothetical protein